MALLEARPYRPFKSSEEYLEAMKEDLAEWLNTLYPELCINAENFMDRLDTGVALCKHANNVRQSAEDYLARRQARNKSMTRSMTSGLAGPILAMGNIHYLPAARGGTFFARDNVSNFITWCRKALKIIECLLFETDDLIMRKNEKHVILCLLEVARRGAKFGMLAPMLVQMERQIDREIAADNKANGCGCGTQTDGRSAGTQTDVGVGTDTVATETDMFDSDDSDNEDDGPMLMYGPQPQIITNDLKSLDEMVRDLVEKCTCPSQFPMIRVSEGKYRIGDTKVLIFVRILRSHVMVRVGGGWDTLSHYLDKHDPCRCRAQHRSSMAARLIPRTSSQTNGIELHRAQVIYERSPPSARKIISSFNNQSSPSHSSSHSATASPSHGHFSPSNLSPNHLSSPKTGSRSPTPQRKFLNQYNNSSSSNSSGNAAAAISSDASISPSSPSFSRRSMSPSPRRLMDMRKKQTSLENGSGPKSLPLVGEQCVSAMMVVGNHVQFDTDTGSNGSGSNGGGSQGSDAAANSNKFENISDNGSEISDEGYRSLGLIQSNAQKRESLHSQASVEDAENNVRLDPTSSDSQLSPVDDPIASAAKSVGQLEESAIPSLPQSPPPQLEVVDAISAGPQSLPIDLPSSIAPDVAGDYLSNDKFEQSGIFVTDEEITVSVTPVRRTSSSSNAVDVASATGLRKTGFSSKIFGGEYKTDKAKQRETRDVKTPASGSSQIPRSPALQRRRSIDNSSCNGSLQDLSARTGLPVFNRQRPVYRSVRKAPVEPSSPKEKKEKDSAATKGKNTTGASPTPSRSVTNTWSGRSSMGSKKRSAISADTYTPHRNSSPARSTSAAATSSPTPGAFERNGKTRSSQVLYDSHGRRVKGCTASLTTSPVKNHSSSPLAQQLLEAASSAKNDAQILERMKTLLSRYASCNQAAIATQAQTQTPARASPSSKKPVYEDFTSAWVHSNGNLERSSSCSPPTKAPRSKRSSAASSAGSTHSQEMSAIVTPRRDRGMSKIPAPVRQHTELY